MPAKMKIRSAYSTLPTAERKVADFILANPSKASLMVINEIAEAAGVSVPSVTRLAKKLGYEGFLDFRVALASGSSSIESIKSEPIRPDDSDPEVVKKLFLSYMRALEDTLKALNREKLAVLAEKCTRAKRIFVVGTASSYLLANDLALQLNYLDYDAVAVSDAVVMDVLTTRFSADDVFIGISRSGRTRLVLDALKAAKNRGTYTAFISNYINSPAANIADGFFCTACVDDMKNITGRESTLTMTSMVGALIMLVARKTQPEDEQ